MFAAKAFGVVQLEEAATLHEMILLLFYRKHLKLIAVDYSSLHTEAVSFMKCETTDAQF